MNYTQFHGNTFLFINKNTEELPLPKESREVDLTMSYKEVEKPSNDTRKQYTCEFINKDSSEASLCGNALLRLMEIEGVGHYVFHTISGFYEGWNNENEMGLLMKKAKIKDSPNVITKSFHVEIGNEHIVMFYPDVIDEGYFFKHIRGSWDMSNIHEVIQQNTNTFKVRCFEKGVGETQACGSGAYAVGIAMIKHLKLSEVNIIMKGGKYLVKEGFLIIKK